MSAVAWMPVGAYVYKCVYSLSAELIFFYYKSRPDPDTKKRRHLKVSPILRIDTTLHYVSNFVKIDPYLDGPLQLSAVN